jgi:hypothetical protein
MSRYGIGAARRRDLATRPRYDAVIRQDRTREPRCLISLPCRLPGRPLPPSAPGKSLTRGRDLLAMLFPHLAGLRVYRVEDTGDAVVISASCQSKRLMSAGEVWDKSWRPLSRDRTRCPRCPASRGRTRCRHRRAAVARVPRPAGSAVRIRPPGRLGVLHPRARCRPVRQGAPGS